MIIKKWNTANGGSWQEQYPKTLETMIYDSNNTSTSLFLNGKLKQAYLPDVVFGGMTVVGTIAVIGSPSSPVALHNLINGSLSGYGISTLDAFTGRNYDNNDYDDDGARYIGHYWIVSTSGISLYDNSTTDEMVWSVAFDDGVSPVTSGNYQNYLALEAGDWVVITGWDNTNKRWKVSVVNNTYGNATTSSKGVVELATATEVGDGTSTTLVASVKDIKDTYSLLTHTHDDTVIDMSQAYSNIGSVSTDHLDDVLTDIDGILGTNTSNISTNATNISTNTSNISTNTSNISTNTSNISTNTSNISTNASDITTLEGRKEVFVQTSANTPTANQANDLWFVI